jgi:hypothetical protein
MTLIATLPRLVSSGCELDADADKLGFMRDSSTQIDDVAALRERMREDGYLFLRQSLDRDDVLTARRECVARLAEDGHLDPAFDPMEAVASPSYSAKFMPNLARDNAALDRVLYAGPMMRFFRAFLGGDVRHFDYTWFRAVAPGKGTAPHCDSVYMGRGTQDLFTAWTPMGDCSFDLGGLMVLEGSNTNRRLRETYGKTDVDTYCANRTGRAGQDAWQKGSAGALGTDPVKIRSSLGGRWLTTEYQAGDVLIFSIHTVHASLDNRSNRVRLSADSRYQRADEAADERWVGERPIGHSQAGKRGRIC